MAGSKKAEVKKRLTITIEVATRRTPPTTAHPISLGPRLIHPVDEPTRAVADAAIIALAPANQRRFRREMSRLGLS